MDPKAQCVAEQSKHKKIPYVTLAQVGQVANKLDWRSEGALIWCLQKDKDREINMK
jgi:hypothetical protein